MTSQIRIAGVVKESIVDGPGIRLVVFAQGCPHHCEGCHNPATHDFNGGQLVAIDAIIDEMKKNPLLDGITLSGGEPFLQPEGFSELAKCAQAAGFHVMTYTGYTFETLLEKKDQRWQRLLRYTDLLVDGRFEAEQKSLLLKFRGSHNQRIIDVKKSQQKNQLVLSEIS
ncbi:MAG: anaerobic ribonucleoside-triphosphate reductase activating protein [Acetobacterium sp. MES1]|uniref:anaerobic ribonucleoside-triphosphate reductase activating protein n=1 Tax=Acetobacterium sp. MES1 TaxID=1899015 RepID=UPI000B9D1C06|nr:anaerobic ribonucleoside-triphosphate reductase activating protein [Acetobacterium sp. MES1]OXS26812.1 MAG: anaerobic ribonucleoside-triphosphate reductase activating protein [Acetobacterium sp. MES1]